MKRNELLLIVATVGVIVAGASMAGLVPSPDACPTILNDPNAFIDPSGSPWNSLIAKLRAFFS